MPSEPQIQFNCPACGKAIHAPVVTANRTGKCPKCHHSVRVPKIELRDLPEERSWHLLQNIPTSELVERFPDFDLAYTRSATPSGVVEDHAGTNPTILEAGLARSRRKSTILAKLAGYYGCHKHDAERCIDFSLQCLIARTHAIAPDEYVIGGTCLMIEYFARVLGLTEEANWARQTYPDVSLNKDELRGLARALANADRNALKAKISSGTQQARANIELCAG